MKELEPYGDLTVLNKSRDLLDTVGKETLERIACGYLDLLGSSAAIYEADGSYASALFSSSYCHFMDGTSRALCDTGDNEKALASGKWICHESCWSKASRITIETGKPFDLRPCEGGINIFAVPIKAGERIIGSINLGYGTPPTDEKSIDELAGRFGIKPEDLLKKAMEYRPRPDYIIEAAKKHLLLAAELIGELYSRKKAEADLHGLNETLEQRVADRTAEIRERMEELQRFKNVTVDREISQLREELGTKSSGHQRRLARIGDCVGQITHDMSNPLSILNLLLPGMKTLSGQCQAELDIPCRLDKKIDRACVQVKRIKRMVGEILDLARGEGVQLNYETVHYGEYLKNIAAHIREVFSEKNLHCEVVLRSAFQGDVELDAERFGRIIENLAINAGNALSQKPDGVVEISSHEEDSMVVTVVSDNGPGVPEEIRETLLSEGGPRPGRKKGYGLLICREMAELHGGSIDCSTSDAGAAFFVRIPKKIK